MCTITFFCISITLVYQVALLFYETSFSISASTKSPNFLNKYPFGGTKVTYIDIELCFPEESLRTDFPQSKNIQEFI